MGTEHDWKIGSLDKRELHVHWVVPFWCEAWDGNTFRFSWRVALWPPRWLWLARPSRYDFRFRWDFRRNTNHRCHCCVGHWLDGCLVAFGFGFVWWYSYFDGEIPCDCDRALAELTD